MTGTEQLIAEFGFNNWEIKYGKSIKATKVATPCSTAYELRVYLKSSATIGAVCPTSTHACMVYTNYYDSGSVVYVYGATLYFNYEDVAAVPGDAQLHIFAHEFGHAMCRFG